MKGLITRYLLAAAFLAACTVPSHAGPLETIRRQVRREVAAGKLPIIVFNIDGTVLDNRPRSQAILRDFVAFNPVSNAEIVDSIYALRPDSIDYYVVDSFQKVGINDLFILESALKFWAEHFFSNRYVQLDVPIAGATTFIREMYDSGAFLVYVSGRARSTMLEGTIQTLQRAGFPVATARTLLVMKPQPRDNNLEFKNAAYSDISRLGRVVAAFENEPRDVNRMKRRWPQAEVVLIHSQHSRDTEPLVRGIVTVDDFTDSPTR